MDKSSAFFALTLIVLIAVMAKSNVCIAFGIAFPNSVTATIAYGCEFVKATLAQKLSVKLK